MPTLQMILLRPRSPLVKPFCHKFYNFSVLVFILSGFLSGYFFIEQTLQVESGQLLASFLSLAALANNDPSFPTDF